MGWSGNVGCSNPFLIRKNLFLMKAIFCKAIFALCVVVVVAMSMTGCVTRERVAMFQDAQDYLDPKRIATTYDIRVQADDQLSIAIASQDPELVAVFNNKTVIGGGAMGATGGTAINATVPLQQSFHVDNDGFVDFPVFGRLFVAGLSRKAVADTIQNRLREKYIKDAVVTVELLSFHVVVLGGVNQETILNINKDRCTIVEAITMAGGFGPGAYRENVLVVREENGEIWSYTVDFRNIADLINSPVYYLQQNDIVYIDKSGVDQIEHSGFYKYLTPISTVLSLITSVTAIIIALL